MVVEDEDDHEEEEEKRDDGTIRIFSGHFNWESEREAALSG